MRHLKTYENMSDNLHIGDYILVHYDLDPVLDIELANYLNNNIGQIPYGSDLSKKYITVNYHTTPNKRILDYFQDQTDYEKIDNIYRRVIEKSYIIAVSKNKDDIEAIVDGNKYNL